jgi:hypothetical protein
MSPLFCFTGSDSPDKWTQIQREKCQKIITHCVLFYTKLHYEMQCVWVWRLDPESRFSWRIWVSKRLGFSNLETVPLHLLCLCLHTASTFYIVCTERDVPGNGCRKVCPRSCFKSVLSQWCCAATNPSWWPEGDPWDDDLCCDSPDSLLGWCLCKGISSLASPLSCIWCAAIEASLPALPAI